MEPPRAAGGHPRHAPGGAAGSESDLAQRGVLLAGGASPWKARIRVALALGLGLQPATVVMAA